MNDEDFTITPSFLEFSNSNDSQSITLSLTDDKTHEKDKIIRICFDPVGDGYDEPVVLDIMLIDNDTPELVLNSSELVVTEGGSDFFSVKLDNKPIEPIVVRVAAVENKDGDFEKGNAGKPQSGSTQDSDSPVTARLFEKPGLGQRSFPAFPKVFLNSDYFVKPFYFSKEDLDNAEMEQLQNLKARFPQFSPINLDDLEEIRRTFQALVKNFSHFNSELFVTDPHFLVFSVYNWNVPQSVVVSANENQYNGDDRWVTISLDPFGEGYDNNQLKKDVEVKIKDKHSNPLPLTLTFFITINIFALRFALSTKINDIDIKFQNKENDLLSEIDEKVADIKTEIEEIKEDVEEIKDKIE